MVLINERAAKIRVLMQLHYQYEHVGTFRMCLAQIRYWEKIHCLQVWGIKATARRYQRFVLICSTDNLCKSSFQWAWNWPWLFVGPQFLSPYHPCEVFRVTLTPKPVFMSYIYVHVHVSLHATIVYFYLTCHRCLLFSRMSPCEKNLCLFLSCVSSWCDAGIYFKYHLCGFWLLSLPLSPWSILHIEVAC